MDKQINTDYKHWRNKFYEADEKLHIEREKVRKLRDRQKEQDKFIQEIINSYDHDGVVVGLKQQVSELQQRNAELRALASALPLATEEINYIDLKREIESFYGIDDISKQSRRMEYTRARQMYYYICRKRFKNLSFKDIGAACNVHHSTVLSALNTFESNIDCMSDVEKDLVKRFVRFV